MNNLYLQKGIARDRFIPSRKNLDFVEREDLLNEIIESQNCRKVQEEVEQEVKIDSESQDLNKGYCSLLQNQVLGIQDAFTIHQLGGNNYLYNGFPFTRKFSLLKFSKRGLVKSPNNKGDDDCFTPSYYEFFGEDPLILPIVAERKIPKIPYKVLDAPALQDDFYLNVMDWSSQGLLAVGLGPCVYLWSPLGTVTKLTDVGSNNTITSIGWSINGNYLSVGTYSGTVQIWDANKIRQIRVLRGHEGRVGSLAWSSSLLCTGSRDKTVMLNDIRQNEHAVGLLKAHKQEVCGLKWSPDEQQLASGGNDNKLFIWNSYNYSRPSAKYSSHIAAVKALAWSPHQHGLLVSGGGTADRTIRSWNTLTNSLVNCIDTGSQVCNLLFSKHVNELVSSHGYSHNHIYVWKHPTMRKIATLSGHTSRVLYLAASNDGETIVTGAGDETLRFWKVFPKQKTKQRKSNLLLPSTKDLR